MITGQGLKILLVDDDRFLLDMYTMKFIQAGHTVASCFSVDEALKELRVGFSPDVVVFDLVMPGQDGFDLLRAVRDEKLAQSTLFIALTNQSAPEEKKKCLDMGADEYVVKATTIPSEVVDLVVAVTKKNRPVSQ